MLADGTWTKQKNVWSLYTVTDHLYIQSLMVFIYSHWSSLYTVTGHLYIQSLIIFIYSHWSSLYTVTDGLYIQSLIIFIYSHWSSLYTVTECLYIQSLMVFIYSHWWSIYTVTDGLYIQSLMVFIYSHWSSLYTVTDGLYIQSLIVFIYSHWSSLYTVITTCVQKHPTPSSWILIDSCHSSCYQGDRSSLNLVIKWSMTGQEVREWVQVIERAVVGQQRESSSTMSSFHSHEGETFRVVKVLWELNRHFHFNMSEENKTSSAASLFKTENTKW